MGYKSSSNEGERKPTAVWRWQYETDGLELCGSWCLGSHQHLSKVPYSPLMALKIIPGQIGRGDTGVLKSPSVIVALPGSKKHHSLKIGLLVLSLPSPFSPLWQLLLLQRWCVLNK